MAAAILKGVEGGKEKERDEIWTFLPAIFDHHGKHILPQCLNL
jgi:hypothetical protein